MKKHRKFTQLQRRIAYSLSVLLATVLLGLLWASVPGEVKADAGPTLTSVETFPVQSENGYTTRRVFVGRIEAARKSDLAFEVAGLVQELHSEEGDRVEKGQVLARLDSQRLRSRRDELAAELDSQRAILDELREGPRSEKIEQARARVKAWESRLELADSTRQRSREAFELNALAGLEWDQARLHRETVSRELEVASQQLRELENGTRPEKVRAQEGSVRRLISQIQTLDIDIQKSTLRAPYSGVLSARLADEGEVFAVGHSVFQLLEDRHLEARIGVASDEVGGLSPGDEKELEVAGKTVLSRVKAILPLREDRSRTVNVLFSIEDPDGLRDGDLVRLALEQFVPQKGFWVPLTALTESVRGLWAALALVPVSQSLEQYRLERRELELLVSQPDRAFVRGTIRDGEQIVAAGLHRLAPGQTVVAVQ